METNKERNKRSIKRCFSDVFHLRFVPNLRAFALEKFVRPLGIVPFWGWGKLSGPVISWHIFEIKKLSLPVTSLLDVSGVAKKFSYWYFPLLNLILAVVLRMIFFEHSWEFLTFVRRRRWWCFSPKHVCVEHRTRSRKQKPMNFFLQRKNFFYCFLSV